MGWIDDMTSNMLQLMSDTWNKFLLVTRREPELGQKLEPIFKESELKYEK
jgi:hypothetical protein